MDNTNKKQNWLKVLWVGILAGLLSGIVKLLGSYVPTKNTS